MGTIKNSSYGLIVVDIPSRLSLYKHLPPSRYPPERYIIIIFAGQTRPLIRPYATFNPCLGSTAVCFYKIKSSTAKIFDHAARLES